MSNSSADERRRRILKATAAALAVHSVPGAIASANAATIVQRVGAVKPWASESPYLSKAFAPVFDERDDADLVVRGTIPAGLRGVFMRNGPNPLFAPDTHYAYPFDGTGMIHALHLDNGRARYRNRWVLTKEVRAERDAGHRIYNSSFSAPPHANLANTNIVHHAGRRLALYEGGAPYAVDDDLATRGSYDFAGKLPEYMSAHPKVDPVTGELLFVSYNVTTGMLTYLRADREGRLDRVVQIASPWPAMVHDIAITEQHVLAFICPFVFDSSRKGPPATWQPERGTIVALIPRDAHDAQQVRWIHGAPFFQFHTMNAFAEGNRVEVTVPWYASFSLTAPGTRLELHRLVVHMDTGALEDEALDDQPCEFARINDAHLGRRARYGYVGLRAPYPGDKYQIGAFEAFARYDLTTGSKVVHQFPRGMTVCEPVFVADPNGKTEEDGFILSFVHDANDAGGSFVILDARNLAAEPLAIVQLPRRVPAGLHGSWTAV